MDVCLAVASGAARGRLVAVLEGGYDLDALADSTAAVVAGCWVARWHLLLGPSPDLEKLLEAAARPWRHWPVARR